MTLQKQAAKEELCKEWGLPWPPPKPTVRKGGGPIIGKAFFTSSMFLPAMLRGNAETSNFVVAEVKCNFAFASFSFSFNLLSFSLIFFHVSFLPLNLLSYPSVLHSILFVFNPFPRIHLPSESVVFKILFSTNHF